MSPSPLSPAESRLFAEEVCDQSLRRLWWLMWLSLVGAVVVSWAAERHSSGAGAKTVVAWDMTCALAGLALIEWQRRRAWPVRARQALILGLLAYTLVVMDAYFLTVISAAGPGASYALGVALVALFFLVRPWFFTACLLVNHVGYVISVQLLTVPEEVKLVAWIEGSFAVLVSILAQALLYSTRRRRWLQQRALAAANTALEAQAAEMNEVMAIAAHDLRSPLQALQLTMQELAEEPDAGERRRLQLAGRAAGEGMLHLIGRLLDAHRAEQRRPGESLLAEDLVPLVADAVERAETTAVFKKVTLRAVLPTGAALARLHAADFSQALDNLIANALKFSPAGSAVEVRLARTDGQWCVEVNDEGPGVLETERDRLFAKFFRGSAEPTGGEAGSGLGLFIVRALMEGMGGSVAFAPRLPGGSSFSLLLRADDREGGVRR